MYDYNFSLRKAGPIGRPGVAADADGNPWVAYTLSVQGQQVRVATKSGDKWTTQTVATVPRCTECAPPRPTQVGVTSAGPTVAWVDNDAGAVMVSVLDGDRWTATEVARGVSGQGLDMAIDADGNALLTFFDAQGAVQLARPDGAGWSVTTIAEAAPADLEAIGNLAPMTSIAIDDEGGMAAAWDDADGVVVAISDDGETFTPIETPDTLGGMTPSVGVAPDGAKVFLAWYDPESQNLRFGVQGDMGELAVAAPSPTADPGEIPTAAPSNGGGECGADGEILLDIEAQTGNIFSTNCLVAPADEAFTINYANTDPAAAHNIHVFTELGGDSLADTDLVTGPLEDPLDVDPLEEAAYYFQCDAHPTTMTGTLAAVGAGGGGAGGGGGGDGGN